MLNIVFLAKDPQVFLEYAVRLENNKIPFWVSTNNNDLHALMKQLQVDVIFADYFFMDFVQFDVKKHIKKSRDDLIFLFLNNPHGVGELLIQWEDEISQNYSSLWTDELDDFLHIMLGVSKSVDFDPPSSSVEALLAGMSGHDKEEGASAAYSGDGRLPGFSGSEKNLDAHGGEMPRHLHRTEEIFPTGSRFSGKVPADNWLECSEDLGSLAFQLWSIRKKYKLGYAEYIILDLFFRRVNGMVDMGEMAHALGADHGEKLTKRIYCYIHKIRIFLQKEYGERICLMRVKKGCYSLVVTTETPAPSFVSK